MALQLRRFESKTPGPHLLITGGVHGDEYEPMVAVRRLISYFDRQHRLVKDFSGTVTLVPVVNEDAFRRGSRVGSDGLDLARTCPGRPDGTITERLAHSLSNLIREADYYIDLHTGGTSLSLLPLAGYMLHADPEILNRQRAMAFAFNLSAIWGTVANLEGRSLSVARDANVPAIYCEFGGAARCDAGGVEAYVDGCINVMGEVGIVACEHPTRRVKHFVEDPRPESGHLQICHPSPIAGFFEPKVDLGMQVAKGSLIGRVINVLGDKKERVYSNTDGIVICLRTLPSVKRGDSLAVVMEPQSLPPG